MAFGIKRLKKLFARSPKRIERSRFCVGTFGGTVNSLSVSEFMVNSAVNRCVRLISESIGAMPCRHLKRDKNGVDRVVEGSLNTLLGYSPDRYCTGFEFWRVAVYRMLVGGCFAIYPVRNATGTVVELHQFGADGITAYEKFTQFNLYDSTRGYNHSGVRLDDLVFVRGLTADGVLASSPASYAAVTVNLSGAADNEARRRIENGGAPQLLVRQKPEGVMGPGAAQEDSLTAFMASLSQKIKEHCNAIGIPNDYEVSPIGSSMVDMQFQSIREFAIREVCRYFGVPPLLVYTDGSASYKTPEAANADFLVNTLDPVLRNIEAELTRKLLPSHVWGSERIEFDRSTRLVADLETRAKYYSQMLGLGVYTPNELRARMGQQPVDGGDVLFVSANLRTIDEAKTKNNDN